MGFPRKIFYSLFQLILVTLAVPQLCCAVNVEVKDPAQAPSKHDQISEQELVICEQDLSGTIVNAVEQPTQRITPHHIAGAYYGNPAGVYTYSFSSYFILIPAQTKAETTSLLYIAFQQFLI